MHFTSSLAKAALIAAIKDSGYASSTNNNDLKTSSPFPTPEIQEKFSGLQEEAQEFQPVNLMKTTPKVLIIFLLYL